MGNYTPGTIKARGGPPRGQIFNLRGYRAPCIMRPQPWPGTFPAGGLIPCRYLAVIIGRTLVVNLRLFLWVNLGLFLPWFGRCVSVAFRLLIRSAAPLLLGVCFVRFVCGSCGFGAGSYDGAGRSCSHPKQNIYFPLQRVGVAVHEGGQGCQAGGVVRR